MPITGRSPADCFGIFEDHVRALVAKTLTERLPILSSFTMKDKITLSFREGVPIKTRYGRLYVHLGQFLHAEEQPHAKRAERYRLRTLKYWYRLQMTPLLRDQALLRWEYESEALKEGWCRHHVQLPAVLEPGLDLDKLHVPTGWVTIEEILRFVIVDLGAKPPCGTEWPDVLLESEKAFFEKFTSKRYRPPSTKP